MGHERCENRFSPSEKKASKADIIHAFAGLLCFQKHAFPQVCRLAAIWLWRNLGKLFGLTCRLDGDVAGRDPALGGPCVAPARELAKELLDHVPSDLDSQLFHHLAGRRLDKVSLLKKRLFE